MKWMRRFFDGVALDRRWWWALFVINSLGSIYGFYWYWPQLRETPVKYWLIVPDSPGSTFLLAIWLLLLLGGVSWRRPAVQLLGAVAFLSNMKYGLWTAVVLPQAGIKYGWEFDFVHLTLSHLAMWVQGLLFARYYKPALWSAAAALLWMWFQDLVDYSLLMTHPTLPYPKEFAFARGVAVAWSTVWGLLLLLQAGREGRARGAVTGRG